MITREDAKLLMKDRVRHINKSANDVIDEIYDSIGSCKECKFSRTNDRDSLYCCKLSAFNECYYYVNDDWYCADFEKRKDNK